MSWLKLVLLPLGGGILTGLGLGWLILSDGTLFMGWLTFFVGFMLLLVSFSSWLDRRWDSAWKKMVEEEEEL